MIKSCIVCEAAFDARGSAKTCSPVCSQEKKRVQDASRRANPEYRRAENARLRKKYADDWVYRDNKRGQSLGYYRKIRQQRAYAESMMLFEK